MRRKNPIAVLTAWLALVLSPTHGAPAADGSAAGAAVQQTGSITGQVSNAATRAFLEGAVVALAGTNQTTITDREGRYHFNGVGTSAVTLEVSFTGLDTQRIPVSVGSGQRLVRDVELTSEIYKLDKFTVAGEREGTAKAEVMQRNAPNVKAVVSSDTFGNVADGNIGNMLQLMAGITANYNGPDVRSVSIRGVGGDLNSVTMDGQQVASSQSAGTGRTFEFEQASLGGVETIEVTKAPTPDMDGASIGGSINLVSKSAFDRAAGRIFTYSVAIASRLPHELNRPVGKWTGEWNQPVTGYGPSTNFSYSDVIGEKKNIGITLTGTVHSTPGGTSVLTQGFERKNEPGPAFNYSTARYHSANTQRSRAAAGAKLDYRWSDRTTISLNTFYNFFQERNDARTMTLATVGVATAATPQVLATVDAAGNRTGGGYIHPDYSNGITRVYPHPTLSYSNLSVGSNDKSGRTYLFAPTVRHRFEGLNIDYGLSYSNSATYYDVSHNKEKYDGRPTGNVTMRLGNIGWTADNSARGSAAAPAGEAVWPKIKQMEGPNIYDLNNYSTPLNLQQADSRGFDTVASAKFDLRKEFALAVPTYIKTGFIYKEQSRKVWTENRRYNYTGPDGVFGTADDNLYTGQDGIFGTADDSRGPGQFRIAAGPTTEERRYLVDRGEGAPPWPDPYAVASHQKLHTELWKEDIAFGAMNQARALRTITERIGAAYVMGNARLGRLSVLGGVRLEDTRLEGEGPVDHLSPEEKARRAAWVGTVTDPEARRRAEAQYGGRATNQGQYRVVLPGVHLKYEPLASLVTRLSWSTGVGRPPFGSIIPLDTVNEDTRRVTRSNPDLKPQYANNYDLTAEYYFKSQGVVSIGAFRKKIADYIFTDSSQTVGSGLDNGFDGDYVGYALTTQANGGFAKIEGVEFNYQQQLGFLPGWAKGFGVNANFTSLKTEGDYGGTTVRTNSSLPGFVNKTGNLGVSYRGYGFDLRLLAVHRGEYLTSYSTTPALVQYQVARTSWTWKSRYAFSRNLTVFFDLENIFSVPLDYRYALYKDRVTSFRIFPAKVTIGITGRY